MVRVNLSSGITFNKMVFSIYDIPVKQTKNNMIVLSGSDNKLLLSVCNMVFSPDTRVSVDGAPEVTLSRVTTRTRKTRGEGARHKSKRVLKRAPEKVAPEMMTVICDGVEKVVPVVKPVKVAPEHATFQTGNPVAESTRRDLLNDWHALGYSDDVPTGAGFRKAADAMEKSGENFKAEALRISAKLCEKYF